MARKSRLEGQTFGKYTVLGINHTRFTPKGLPMTYYDTRCEGCGKQYVLRDTTLRRNQSGCRECAKTRNAAMSANGYKHPLFKTWWGMISRCYDPNSTHFAYYGAKGVQVCDRWRGGRKNDERGTVDGFHAFLEDMGARPSTDHSLDRIDPFGNYELSNCRWATAEEQANNKRDTVLIAFNGELMGDAQWARRLGRTGSPSAIAREYGVDVTLVLNAWWNSKHRYALSKALGSRIKKPVPESVLRKQLERSEAVKRAQIELRRKIEKLVARIEDERDELTIELYKLLD